MSYVTETLGNLIHQTAFFNLSWGNLLMILVALVFLYLAIKKGYEPLLLVPIAFATIGNKDLKGPLRRAPRKTITKLEIKIQ